MSHPQGEKYPYTPTELQDKDTVPEDNQHKTASTYPMGRFNYD